MGKKIIYFILILVVITGGYYGYKRYVIKKIMAMRAAAQAAGGPMPMPAAKCVLQDITDSLEFTGTTEAVNAVAVRARVEGYLKGIHFTDGAEVKQGDLLFTIEPDAYLARRDQAEAQLKAAWAELDRAQLDYERMEKAIQANAVSKQDLTTKKAQRDQAQASVMAAQADLKNAELNVGYTEIRSPIDGRIGRRMVDVGNLVGSGDHTILTTIQQIRPMYVFFHVGEQLLEGGFLQQLQGNSSVKPLTFLVGLPNQDEFPYEGVLHFLDNTVDPQTGTVYVRGEIPNESGLLLPGMFVRVRLPMAERKNAVLVPEKAVSSDLGGKYLLIVGQGNVLQRRDVKLGTTIGELRVITEGLDGSETFIVGGFHMARPGMPITPLTAEMQNKK